MVKIALAGNPNCGKTMLFNALTGSNQYVGNWAGVTRAKAMLSSPIFPEFTAFPPILPKKLYQEIIL